MTQLRILCKRHGVEIATVDDAEVEAPVVSWLEFDAAGVRFHRSIRELLALDESERMRQLGLSQPVRALKVRLESRRQAQRLHAITDARIMPWCSACGERLVVPVAALRARHAEALRVGAEGVWRVDERIGRDQASSSSTTSQPASVSEALALLAAVDLEQLAGVLHELVDADEVDAERVDLVRQLVATAVAQLSAAADAAGSSAAALSRPNAQ